MPAIVRTIVDGEIEDWSAAISAGFHNTAGDADAAARRPHLILDRTWGGFDGDRVVSTFRSFPVELTMPGGGEVATSAITAVTTSGTHRRQGLATAMMTADLRGSKERGEVAAALIAAEWPIYGRFGFGAATQSQVWTVQATGAQLRHRVSGSVEFVDRDTARAEAPAVYDQQRRLRSGELTRDDRFWDLQLDIVRYPSWGEEKKGLYVLARDANGEPVGVLRYRVEEKEEYRRSISPLTVDMLIAASTDAEILLWTYLLDLDLVDTVVAGDRPVDGLLPWLLTDARRARPSDRVDHLWVRPLDLPAYLSARTYSADTATHLVLEVIDPLGLAGGRVDLQAGPDGVDCEPTTAAADLTLGLSALGSISLGGFSPRTLAAAGLVDEHVPGAIDRADTLFRTRTKPWCSTWF